LKAPIGIDLFCGLGGWTDGLLAEGYDVTGFDITAHDYGDGKRYPAKLVIADVLTLHGSQFKDAALIVASPPCQRFSYMAMPWKKAKAIASEYRSGVRDVKELTALFDACFRIQREAIEAAGHFIPMVVENVRGAQPWVGKAKWNFGSYYLWGDVPALMPITMPRRKSKAGSWDLTRANYNADTTWDDGIKLSGNNSPRNWSEREVQRPCDAPVEGFKSQGMKHGQDFTRIAGEQAGQKTVGHVNKRDGYAYTKHLTCQSESDGVKGFKDFNDCPFAQFGSKSNARKAASAMIAKIPLPLAQWIARVWKPK
jgi:hypothetical protein